MFTIGKWNEFALRTKTKDCAFAFGCCHVAFTTPFISWKVFVFGDRAWRLNNLFCRECSPC